MGAPARSIARRVVPARDPQRLSPLRFHEGRALQTVAQTYPTILGMVLEVIQNAIDSSAKNIWLLLNFKSRQIVVRDDGDGVTPQKFDQSLASVGVSQKSADKLGQYGRGLVSPLDKCAKFVFTSSPVGQPRKYREWTFVCADIIAQEHDIHIPNVERTDLNFSRAAEHRTGDVNWRTEMRIENFRKDTRLQGIDLETLTNAVQDRYSKAMQRQDTTLYTTIVDSGGNRETREIKAKRYMGTPLPAFEHSDPDAGKTRFTMFWAPKGIRGYRGKVLVGEVSNDFRFDFQTFWETSASKLLPAEIAEALKSGVFEGEILAHKARMNADRKSFAENDALVGYCAAIEDWFLTIGSEQLAVAKDSDRERQLQAIGVRSIRTIRGILQSEQLKSLAEVLDRFKRGSLGTGHADVDARTFGKQDKSAVSADNTGLPHSGSGGSGSGSSGDPAEPKPKHHPYTVQGPKGSRRVVVKDDSTGLQFAYGDIGELWELDMKYGILYFNTRHPLWVFVEEEGGWPCIMRMQEHIALQALVLETIGDAAREYLVVAFHEELTATAHLLVKGDKLAGRHTVVHKQPVAPTKKTG